MVLRENLYDLKFSHFQNFLLNLELPAISQNESHYFHPKMIDFFLNLYFQKKGFALLANFTVHG